MNKRLKDNLFGKVKDFIRRSDFLYWLLIFSRSVYVLPKYLSSRNYPIVEIVNCGMPRSGTTLLHNIIQEVLSNKFKEDYNFCVSELSYFKWLAQSNHYDLVKIHFYSPLVASRIRMGKAIGFFAHRDIRDIVASKIQKGWITDVDDYIKSGRLRQEILRGVRYGSIPCINLVAYKDLLENRKQIIYRVSKLLTADLDEDVVQGILDKTKFDRTKKSISSMQFEKFGKSEVNKRTGLHKNHLSDNPRPGKWKAVLNSDQEKKILRYAKEYQEFFGYG